MNKKLRFQLVLFLLPVIFCFFYSSDVYGWSSISQAGLLGGFGTHQYLNKEAYKLIQRHPAFPDNFPSLESIQEYSGVNVKGQGRGPDNPENSLYSWHYYNPKIKGKDKGKAPEAIERYRDYLQDNLNNLVSVDEYNKKQSPSGRNAAYAAHFMQDMAVGFHVVGTYYSMVDSAQPMSENVVGPYRKFSKDEWQFLVSYARKHKDKGADWFDPNYFDGNSINPVLFSSHILYEGMIEVIYKDNWMQNKFFDIVSSISMSRNALSDQWKGSEDIEDFAIKFAAKTRNRLDQGKGGLLFDSEQMQRNISTEIMNYASEAIFTVVVGSSFNLSSDVTKETRKILRKYVKVPYEEWRRAIQASYTVWRASFSALRVEPGGVLLEKVKGKRNLYDLKVRVSNLEPLDSARQVKVEFEFKEGLKGKGQGIVVSIDKESKSDWIKLVPSIRMSDPTKRKGKLLLTISGTYKEVPNATEKYQEISVETIPYKAVYLDDYLGSDVNLAKHIVSGLSSAFVIKVLSGGKPPSADKKDLIIAQVPRAEWVHPEESIVFTAYGEYLVEVPDLEGDSLELAIEKLKKLGLGVNVDYVDVPHTERMDIVKNQKPASGSMVRPGDEVTLTLSRPLPKPPEPPAPSPPKPVKPTKTPKEKTKSTGQQTGRASSDDVPLLGDLRLVPGSGTIEVGQFIKFMAVPIDLYGQPVVGDDLAALEFSWIVNDASKANVSGSHKFGALSGVRTGTVQIICRAAGALGVATVTIVKSPDGSEDVFSGQGRNQRDADELDGHFDQEEDSGFGQKTKGVTTKKYIKPRTAADRARERAAAAEFDAMMRAEKERQKRVWADGQQDINRAVQQMSDTMNLMGQSYSGQEKQTSQQKEHKIGNPYKKYESYTGEEWNYGESKGTSSSQNEEDGGWFSKANINYSPGKPNGTSVGNGKKICPNGNTIKMTEVCEKFIPYHD